MFNIEQIPCRFKLKLDILALGSDTRQRISWVHKGRLFSLWPKKDFLDLSEFYKQGASFLKEEFKFSPKILTFDPHPLFICHREAGPIKEKYFPRVVLCPVFHHLAHVANFAFDVGLNKSFIGLAFDGTGFGSDGRIWGGEFFIYDKKHFRRMAHFDYQALVGSDMAILEPWRIAFAVLYKIYGNKIYKEKMEFLRSIPKEELKLIQQMLEKDFNVSLTSSVGRLFDAVSALLNIKKRVIKEAEAAVALEKRARLFTNSVRKGVCVFSGEAKTYDFKIKKEDNISVIDVGPLFRGIVKDIRQKKTVAEMAYQFHATLAEIVFHVCSFLRKKKGVRDVYFSGGVFMNDILTEEIKNAFLKSDFRLYFGARPATTDLGISKGQIAFCHMERLCA